MMGSRGVQDVELLAVEELRDIGLAGRIEGAVGGDGRDQKRGYLVSASLLPLPRGRRGDRQRSQAQSRIGQGTSSPVLMLRISAIRCGGGGSLFRADRHCANA